jgi:hypothetical protein
MDCIRACFLYKMCVLYILTHPVQSARKTPGQQHCQRCVAKTRNTVQLLFQSEETVMSREVVVVSGVRTAIGAFGASLKDTPPIELATLVVRESLARAGVDGKDVGHVVFGHVVNTEARDMYLSRVAAVNGGCAEGTPAFNVNRLCGSGLQAIIRPARASCWAMPTWPLVAALKT